LAGLIALATVGKKKGRILPIWHRVSAEEVLSFSPPLADLRALRTAQESLETIALQILRVVRPAAAVAVGRRAAFAAAVAAATPEIAALADLKRGPIRHKTLPASLRVRIALVNEVFQSVFPRT
jgi:hypothetical protein